MDCETSRLHRVCFALNQCRPYSADFFGFLRAVSVCPTVVRFNLWFLIVSIIASMQFGCDRKPVVRVYDVPKTPSKSEDSKTKPPVNAPFLQAMSGMQGTPGDSKAPSAMLIGVVPNKESVLFIKASDSPANLELLKPQLQSLTESIQFGESEKPTWKLPDDWSEQPGTGIAMANFLATVKPDATSGEATKPSEIKFTVTQLPKPPADEDWPEYFLQNINRWRKQLGLPETSIDKMESDFTAVDRSNASLPAYLVKIDRPDAGLSSNSSSSEMPTPSQTPPAKNAGPMPPVPAAGGLKVEYTAPEGWVDEGAKGMRAASFKLSDGDDEGEVTVMFLGGDTLANVQRWQTQVNPIAPPAEIQKSTEESIANAKPVKTAHGLEGNIYSLRGPKEHSPSAIDAAIISLGEGAASCFVKLTGNESIAQQNREKLEQFIGSLKW